MFTPTAGQRVIAFTKVRLPFGWLGNMSHHPVRWDGKEWPTTEALFQALRFPYGHLMRETIRAINNPMKAKITAKGHVPEMYITPMSLNDLDNMRMVLHLKHEQYNGQDSEIGKGIAEIKAMQPFPLIVEDSSKRKGGSSQFWGASKVNEDGTAWIGLNMLGVLWAEELSKCLDNQQPDGPVCPKCGGSRAPSGADGGSWVHLPGARVNA